MKYSTLVAVLTIAIFAIACQQQAQTRGIPTNYNEEVQPIKIGVMLPLSGDAAVYGQSMKRGIELADKELDTHAQFIFEDTQCDSKSAVTAFTKLANVDKVQAVIGEACSGATLAAAPLAEQYQVVLISPASTSPAITDAGEFTFRVVPSDALQGKFAADILNRKGMKSVGIIYSNDDYGAGFSEVLEREFAASGGITVAKEAVTKGTIDLRTPLTKIKDARPDAIFIISNSPDSVVAALKQIRELGIDAELYGSEALKSDGILQGAGDAAEGLIISSVSAGTSTFSEHHTEMFGEGPGQFAAQAYDAYKALALAWAVQSSPVTGESLRDQLTRTGFDGASGTIAFDEHGDVAGNYDVYIVRNGAFVLE